jgi:hypothetical protein
MKRNTPLKRNVGLVRKKSAPGNPYSSLNKLTPAQAARNRKYYQLKAKYLDTNTICMARFEGCTTKATHLHHAKGRGKFLLVVKYFRALCEGCHNEIENQPKLAMSLDLSLSRLTK